MMKIKSLVLIVAAALAVLSSCVQEQEVCIIPVSGLWARVDSDMFSDSYIEFSSGSLSFYHTDNIHYVNNGVVTNSDKSEFSLAGMVHYSIVDGYLLYESKKRTIYVDGDELFIDSDRYVRLVDFDSSYYFSIVIPDGRLVNNGYGAERHSVRYQIENFNHLKHLSAVSNVGWIHIIDVDDEFINFSVDEYHAERRGSITLSYFGAESAELEVVQKVNRIVDIKKKEYNVGYQSQIIDIPYSINNPISGERPSISGYPAWISSVEVLPSSIRLHLNENPSNSSRTACLDVAYKEADPIQLSVSQGYAVSGLTVSKNLIEVDYHSNSCSFSYSISNLRNGESVSVSSPASWIGNISIQDSKISFTVEENKTNSARTATLKVRYSAIETDVVVHQTFEHPCISLTSGTFPVAVSGGSVVVPYSVSGVRTNESLKITSNDSWLTVSSNQFSTSASGYSGNITFKASGNTSGKDRTGSVSLSYFDAEATVFFTQSGAHLSASPHVINVGTSQSNNVINVSSDVPWSASCSDSWISVSPSSGPTGTTKVTITSASSVTDARYADITFRSSSYNVSDVVRVTQSSFAPELSLNCETWDIASASYSKDVSVSSNASWTASCDQSWLSISNISGSSFTMRASSNFSMQDRAATVKVKMDGYNLTRSILVEQSAFSPVLSVNTSGLSFGKNGGTSTFDISANSDWTIEPTPSWVLLSVYEGNGSKTVSVSVADNENALYERETQITVRNGDYGQKCVISVSQSAFVPSLSVSQSTWMTGSGSNSMSTVVESNCNWEAVSNQSWLSVSPASGNSGTGSLSLSVSKNTNTSPRQAFVTVRNSSFNVESVIEVTQDAFVPSIHVSEPTISIETSAQCSKTLSVDSNVDWTIISIPSWISTSTLSHGEGIASISLTISANSSVLSRSGGIVFYSSVYGITESVSVSQVGDTPYVSLNMASWSPTATSSSTSLSISSNTTWSVVSSQSWLTVSSYSGSGNGTITLYASSNTGLSRTATLTVKNADSGCQSVVTVTQQAFEASISLSSDPIAFTTASSSSKYVTVTANCGWTVTSNDSWISLGSSSGSSGSYSLYVSVSNNTELSERTGSISFKYTATGYVKTVSVTQAAFSPSITYSPSSLSFASSSSLSASVSVTSNCDWTVSSNSSWLTLSRSSGYSGTLSMTVYVTANSDAFSRTGTITFRYGNTDFTRSISVTQAGVGGSITLSQDTVPFGNSSSSISVSVTSNCDWTVTSNASWLTTDLSSGTKGTSQLKISASSYTGTSARIGVLTFTNSQLGYSKTLTVTQGNALSSIRLTGSGSYPWEKYAASGYTSYLRSTNYQKASTTSTSTLTISLNSATTLSFGYNVSSESNYDKLTITVDGTQVVSAISGTKSGTIDRSLSSGTHTVVLTYSKDGSVNSGSDRAWISNITIGGVVIPNSQIQ